MEDGAVNVGPEFFEQIEYAIKPNLSEPLLLGFRPRAFMAWIIRVRDCRAGEIAANFRHVEGSAAGIGPGDEQSAHRVA